jgi:hypothetical protein
MANVKAFNAEEAGDILVWRPLGGGDSAVVYKYTCPVDNHKALSAVQVTKCPVHDVALTGEAAVAL